ncbi:DMT family transporter [Oceanirhabdus sp. W0125-5]|uniref:DMT family transporter n=1 Tax=Oceanirhabdus sp. W0125-5 TaxID=2999116 RepID=UPI0022F30474|nr:DMT family transporter [Oceanirhabdus sp. W0125-5]WBW94739.1 DMT family transporter [Oceanirhabdus sp. W0125-5]
MGTNKLKGHIACLITVIIWGMSFVSIKYCLEVFRPMSLAFIRFLIATVILFIITRKSEKFDKIDKRDIPLMAISGIIGISIYFFCENNGIEHTEASIASLLLATIPIFTLFADRIVFKEKLTIRKWIGIFVSFAGVAMIIGVKVGGGTDIIGYIYMIGAVLAWVIYSVATKPLVDKYSQITIVYYQSMFGALALFPFIFSEKNNWEMLNLSIVLNVLYLAIFCSVLGYIWYVFSVNELGISLSSLYINLMPLVTLIGSYFILGEAFGINKLIGGALVILSVFIVSNNNLQGKNEVEETIYEVH